MTRPRTIFQISAEHVSERFVYVDLITQAGTYIKEFVHGDLGRTVPSLANLLCPDAADLLCDLELLDGTLLKSDERI